MFAKSKSFQFSLQSNEKESGCRDKSQGGWKQLSWGSILAETIFLFSSHPSRTYNAPKCILFLNVKEKKKKKEGEKPLWLWLSHSGKGSRKAERTSGGIKEMQIFLSPRPYSGLQPSPLPSPLSRLPSPGLHWNVKCSWKGGPWWERTALLTCRFKLVPSVLVFAFPFPGRLSSADFVWDGGGGGGVGSRGFPPGGVKEAPSNTLGRFLTPVPPTSSWH